MVVLLLFTYPILGLLSKSFIIVDVIRSLDAFIKEISPLIVYFVRNFSTWKEVDGIEYTLIGLLVNVMPLLGVGVP